MDIPYAEINGKIMVMSFSSADFSVANVLSALREHLDMLEEMDVAFTGISTDIPTGPSPVFRPVAIKAQFEYRGKGNAKQVMERTYQIVWRGIVTTFPGEADWAEARAAYSNFIVAQADLLRVRLESTGEE